LVVTGSKVPVADANPLATPPLIVRPDHILAVLKAYLPSASTAHSSSASTLSPTSIETVSKVRSLGLQVRLALLCPLLASKRTATLFVSGSTSSTPTKSPMRHANSTISQRTAGLDIAQLHTYYSSVLTRGDNDIFTPVSRSEFSDLVGMLETVGLFCWQRSFFSVKDWSSCTWSGCIEEEVRAIWVLECGHIARESKTKSAAGASVDKPFEEAFED
jgi:cell division control protein 6